MKNPKSSLFLAVFFAVLFFLNPAKAYASAEADRTVAAPEVVDCEVIHEPEFGGVYIKLTIEEFNDLGFQYGDSVNITFSNGYTLEDLPYYNGYYTATGDPLLIAYPGYDYIKAAINNGDDLWVVAGLEGDSLADITLAEPGRYLDIQNARDIHYTDEREDYESDAVFANFRSVTEGDIREGVLYRSASPCDDQHNRASYVDRLIADAGVEFILNLSDDDEKIQGYLSDNGFSSPYFLSLYEAGNVAPIALNMNFGSDEFKQKIAGGLAAMAEKSGPYLIHCTEGKDRTGFVCMLIEALCGASYEEIVADYMITYANYYGITEEADAARYEIIVENVLVPMIQSMVGDDTLDITSAELAGYAEAYCVAGGMSAEQIEALRGRLTYDEPSTEPTGEPSTEPTDEPSSEPLSLWTEDSAAREELIAYMEAVTDEAGEDYIPVDHRVAVFDLDGTLFCETDPNYFDYCLLKYRVLDDPDYKDQASEFEREVARKIQEQNETGASFEGLEVDHGKAVASAFAGMTPEEFNAYIQEFKKQPMPTYDGMNRGDGWYLPMLQVVDYLKENDFTVYIVSGTDRFIVRGIVDESPLDLPPWQIIGSDETLVATDQGDTDGLSYVYDEDDALVLGGDFIVKNLKMNKVTVIAQEIGVQPVLSFGNSTGDSSMAAYVTSGNPYRSLAFMLCCDDTERENGNVEKADKMFDLCGTYGWVPVSMKNDWTTIYGDGVTYLGVPHPTEATEPAEILAGMTVEQKLAQMTMVAFNELDEAVTECLSDTQPGGILLFAGNTPSAADTAVLTTELQQLALETSGIPLLISTDQEGGHVVRMTESTWFPGNMALAATGDTENAYTAASIMGEELLACGINVNFGPVVDVNVNPANPVIGVRSFGEDPETVAAFGAAYVNGLHEAGVISSPKHFPGHGDTDTDSHTGLPSVDKSLDELRAFELVPFQAAIDAGADMVMTAHIVYPQVETSAVASAADGEAVYLPATLSRTILTDLLREEMGFEGVIVTDSLIMDAIAENFGLTEAAAMAINAGADILLDPVRIQSAEDCETYTQLIRDLAALVEQGAISEERLDESVLRILELKDKYGILDREPYGIDPEEAAENAQTVVNSDEHKTVEREITEQAITLVKNDGVIPYTASAEDKIVVLTAWDSEAPAAEYGIQTAVEAGAIPADADVQVVSFDERRIGDISEAIDGASLCILLSRMGSEAYLDPTAATGAAGTLVDIAIDRVHEQGGKVIVVSVQLPYDVARYPEADAVVAAYNPIGSRKLATEDEEETIYNYAPNIPAALRMIFDGTPMTGTLPVSVPALTEDFAFADEILFPAGRSAVKNS